MQTRVILICVIVFMPSLMLFSQTLEGKTFRVSNVNFQYPIGYYWLYNFYSEGVYDAGVDDERVIFKVNQKDKKIQVDRNDDLCSYELFDDTLHISCKEQKYIGVVLNEQDERMYAFAGERDFGTDFNIELALAKKKGKFVDKLEADDMRVFIDMELSAYRKSVVFPNEKVGEPHFQMLYHDPVSVCKLRDICSNGYYSYQVKNNYVEEHLTEFNKANSCHAVLYIDRYVPISDVNTVLSRIVPIETIQDVYICLRDEESKEFSGFFKILPKKTRPAIAKDKLFYEWVALGFPTLKEQEFFMEFVDE